MVNPRILKEAGVYKSYSDFYKVGEVTPNGGSFSDDVKRNPGNVPDYKETSYNELKINKYKTTFGKTTY
jgi:hypothetical protein